ncbi:unnamed protein product, partial [Acanthoscelides obtectus]
KHLHEARDYWTDSSGDDFDHLSGNIKLESFTTNTRQPIFVQLLQSAFRVSQCPWLTASQRFNVENCIRTLSEVDLESQVTSIFNKQTILTRQTSKWLQASKTPKMERSPSQKINSGRLFKLNCLFWLIFCIGQNCCFHLAQNLEKDVNAEDSLEKKEEKLCVQVLRTLREMMAIDSDYGEKGDALRHSLLARYFGKSFMANTTITLGTLPPPPPVSHGPGGKYCILYPQSQECMSLSQ